MDDSHTSQVDLLVRLFVVSSAISFALSNQLVLTSPDARIEASVAIVVASLAWVRRIATPTAIMAVFFGAVVAVTIPRVGVFVSVAVLFSVVPGRHNLRYLAGPVLAGTLLIALFDSLRSLGLLWQQTAAVPDASSLVIGLFGPAERLGEAYVPVPALFCAWAVWLGAIITRPRLLRAHYSSGLALAVGTTLSWGLKSDLLAIACFSLTPFSLMMARASPELSAEQGPARARGRTLLSIVACVLLGCLSHQLIARSVVGSLGDLEKDGRPRIGVLQGGMASFELPAGILPVDTGGPSFAGAVNQLRAAGAHVELIPDSFNASELNGVDLLVVINPTTQFTESQLVSVEQFVFHGGRLLLLTDHTDIGGVMGPSNALLRATSIRVRFDSAIPEDAPLWAWRRALRTSRSTCITAADNNDDFRISVGASLAIGPGARPLIWGVRCFSDKGDESRGLSRLGDMSYNRGERRGSLVLAAEEYIGDGIVHVWGDTSGFQDGGLIGASSFILHYIEALLRLKQPRFDARTAIPLGILAMCGAVVLGRRSRLCLASCLAGLLICAELPTGDMVSQMRIPDTDRTKVVFDTTCRPYYPSRAKDVGMSHLASLLIQNGFNLRSGSFFSEDMQPGDVVIIVEPTASYSEEQVDDLVSFCERGGQLIIAASPSGSEKLQSLMARLGAMVLPEHAGAAHLARLDDEQLVVPSIRRLRENRARSLLVSSDDLRAPSFDPDVRFNIAYAVHAPGWSSLVTCWDLALISRSQLGLGSVTVIGDSQLFCDKVLGYAGTSGTIDRRNAELVLAIMGIALGPR